jgi:hypothetical protein
MKHVLLFSMSLLSLIFLATSCVKVGLNNTDHPDSGKIVSLTTVWDDRSENVAIPGSYNINVADYTGVLHGITCSIEHLFPAGTYNILLWNDVPNVAVGAQNFVPATATADYAAGEIGYLFTGQQQVTVEQDNDYVFTVEMHQQVRELTLLIEPTGGTADKIESIEASLSGVAGTLDPDSDAHGSPANVALTFSKITTGDNAGKWTATVRLLGIAGSEQKLTGTITFAGGSPGDMPLTSDLSTNLAQFNVDKKTPLTLGGTVAETPTGTGFTATINGWTPVDGGTGIAN